MSKDDHLSAYAEGWTTGNADKILSALADTYVPDDPNHGRVAKGEMPAYFDGMKATVSELRGGKLTAWCWWTVPGKSIAGGGLIKVSDDGVVWERLTYYTSLSA